MTLQDHSIPVWIFIVAWNVLFLAWFTGRMLKRPRISRDERDEIVYEERWISGCRLTNLWTRMGSARNCLHTIFLKDKLIIRVHYPFCVIAVFYGFGFEISYTDILSVIDHKAGFLGQNYTKICFKTQNGNDSMLFTPRNREKALTVLREHCGANTTFEPGSR